MKVRYIYSACVVVETPDVTVCSDPWFTPGANYGSWFQYPPLPQDPLEILGRVDVIYISHIHSDHYDPEFIRRYLTYYPDTKIIVAKMEKNFLLKRMQYDGFDPQDISSLIIGDTTLSTFINKGWSFDLDTALVVSHGGQSVANLNDNRLDGDQVTQIKSVCPGGHPTVSLLPWTGAGPYPQTYHFDDPADRDLAAERKGERFLKNYENYCEVLETEHAIPFAGQYVLGGPLAWMNRYRGNPDATAVLKGKKVGGISTVLADGGDAVFDLDTMTSSATRTKPYDIEEIDQYLKGIPFDGYHYEQELSLLGDKPLPILRLLQRAYEKAISGWQTANAWQICVKPTQGSEYFVLNSKTKEDIQVLESVDHLEPRWEFHMDERLLYFCLSGYYHFNEAQGGSHIQCLRKPNEYSEDVIEFMFFLSI